jgi:predicted Zn-ribbon and HTH transcriptional regulator
MNQKMMIDIDAAFDDWLETLTPKELAEFYELVAKDLDSIEDAKGVQIVEDDECVAPKEEIVEPKVAVKKTKCRCCGFAKKHYRVNAEGICKVCYIALATSDSNSVTIVGRQGKKGHNAVSIVVGGERVKVSRKVRLDS